MPDDKENWSPPSIDYKGVKDYSYSCRYDEFYSFEYLGLIEWALAEFITIEFSSGIVFPKMLPIKGYQDFPKWLFSAFNHILELYRNIISIEREAQSKS